MPLGRVIRCLLCRGNEAVTPVDGSSAAGISSKDSNAEAVPLVGLQLNPSAAQTVNSSRRTLLPPSLDGEQFDAPVEHHQDHLPTRVSRRPEEGTSSPPTSSHIQSHIQEANINHVGGHYFDNRITHTHLSPDPARDPGLDAESRRLLDELRTQSSLGAISYAEARADAGRCHPVTRVKALNDLEAWSVGEGPWGDVKLLVLTGPAGHGKSAIMQSFADRLLEKAKGSDPHPVIATFFFKTTVPEQNQPRALVTTLAHQVAEHWPSFRRQIVAVLRDNPGIFSISLEHQMRRLLVDPFSDSWATSPSPSLNVACAVDGLDECDGDEAQSRVIRLLHSLTTIPNTRVVVASRPELAVMEAVSQGMPGMLHVDLNKGDTQDDIHKFVWARLCKIRDMSRLKIDPLRWPSEEDAWRICDYSSGQFILAATAMKYVGERRHDPRERLKEVLALCRPGRDDVTNPVVPSTQPLGPLDRLFAGILVNAGRNATPNDPEEGQLRLSSLVWTLMKIAEGLPLRVLEESQGLPAGSIVHALSDLNSLLEVPEDPYWCRDIRPHHKSFLDFLGDPTRSGHLGNIPEVAKERFDLMIKAHLSLLTVNDLKDLALAQPVKPRILHHLGLLYKPETIIESIDPKVWKALLPLLNAWETLVLKAWVYLRLSGRDPWQKVGGWAENFRVIDEACKGNLHDTLFPGFKEEESANPPSVSDTDFEFLLARLGGQGDQVSRQDNFAFIPEYYMGPVAGDISAAFPWLLACCTLAWLWASTHRVVNGNSKSTQPPSPPKLHPQEPSRVVFVIGSTGSGKRELLEEAYEFLITDEDDEPPESWVPPVDIIIIPDPDGLTLRARWTLKPSHHVPCGNKGMVKLSHQVPRSLFQDWVTSWQANHENNTYQPQFLLQGLHLLSPEHQATILDIISSDAQQSHSAGRPPFFITVTSLPTATLASRLRQFSWPGVYYINLDGMKADASLLEAILLGYVPFDLPRFRIRRMACILAASPKPARHLKTLIDHRRKDFGAWGKRLDPILAEPEDSEAWRLVEQHFGDISSGNEGGESGEDN